MSENRNILRRKQDVPVFVYFRSCIDVHIMRGLNVKLKVLVVFRLYKSSTRAIMPSPPEEAGYKRCDGRRLSVLYLTVSREWKGRKIGRKEAHDTGVTRPHLEFERANTFRGREIIAQHSLCVS